MALLKFKCNDCDEVFEELVKGNSTICKCPKCESENTSRYYRGKCYFGTPGSAGSSCSSKNCSTCSGCSSN